MARGNKRSRNNLETIVLPTSDITIAAVDNETKMTTVLSNLSQPLPTPNEDITNDKRNIFGIFSVSRLLTGLTCMFTVFQWTVNTGVIWVTPGYVKVLRVIVGFNTEKIHEESLELTPGNRLTWYALQRVADFFLNCRQRSPVLRNQYVRGASFMELWQTINNDRGMSYYINVGYWDKKHYHQLWILYNGMQSVFLSLWDGSNLRAIDLPEEMNSQEGERIDTLIRTRFLQGPHEVFPCDDDITLFGFTSAMYTPYYLQPGNMSAENFLERLTQLQNDLEQFMPALA